MDGIKIKLAFMALIICAVAFAFGYSIGIRDGGKIISEKINVE